MTTIYWTPWVFLVQWILLFWGVCGFLGSHVAGLRDEDRLDGFKTGLLFGPIGVAALTFKTGRVPDVEVVCPHCKTKQAAGRLPGLVRVLAV